ncbi:MAG: hypothetical protein ACREHG_04965 [Candidatus Saccharimonadales bacterium]
MTTDRAFIPGTFILPLVAEPEADIGALILAVVLFALPVALTMIAYALKAVPIGIVQSAGDHILSGEKRILGMLAGRVESAIRPFTLMVATPVALMDLLFANIMSAFSETRAKLDDIKRGTIPHYFHSALTWTAQQVAAAKTYAHLLATENYNRILHYYNLSIAHTDHYFKSAISHADAVGQDAKHYAHLHDTILHDEIIHYYGEAQRYADDDLNKALHRADVVKVAAETFATGIVGTAVHYLSDVISHRLAPISAKAETNRVKIDNYIDDCGQPLCEGLLNTPPKSQQQPTKGGHGFAKDLPKLFELVEGLAFLGFIEEMIREPTATARDTFAVADDTVTGTVAAFRDLTGV